MAQDSLAILPRPKSVKLGGGAWRVPASVKVVVSPDAEAELWFLKRALKKAGCVVASVEVVERKGAFLAFGKRPSAAGGRARPRGDEGYVLAVDKDGVRIQANTATGLFWGLQTLAQMLEDDRRLSVGRIADYPDSPLRAMHLDFKGTFPTRARLWKWVEILAAHKMNAVLVEYEDKVRYDGDPAFVSPDALTKKEVRRFVAHCRKHHVQAIPLLQCLGHAEYILRHPEFAHLRERPDRLDQFCPAKPETLELFSRCANELIDLHPDSEWFHIGADETRALGQCPACKRRARRGGELGVYVDYLKKALAVVQQRGRRPMFWDDMLTRNGRLDALRELPGDYAVAYWDYSTVDADRCPYLLTNPPQTSEEWLVLGRDAVRYLDAPEFEMHMPERGMSPELRRIYNQNRRHYEIDESPRFFRSFPHIRSLHAKGATVIGCGAARVSKQQRFSTPSCVRNLQAWALAAKREGLAGLVATSWSRSGSLAPASTILEDAWYPNLGAAEFFWSAETDLADFDRRFNRRFLGFDHTRATDMLYTLERPTAERGSIAAAIARGLADLAKQAPRNRLYMRQLAFVAKAEAVLRPLLNTWLLRDSARFAPTGPGRGVATAETAARESLDRQLAGLASLRAEGLRIYKRLLTERDAAERIDSLIAPLEMIVKASLRELAEAARG